MRKRKENRYEIVDSFRGLTMISMIVYHTIWDLVYIFNINWQWFHSEIAFFWQQSICWTFILLSGFCWSFGKRQVKRGCTIFLAGFAITIITMFVMPENRIIFGILTLLGISILLMKQLDPFFIRIHPILGTVLSFSIFLLLRNINQGFIGIGDYIIQLPKALYNNYVTTLIGFPFRQFYSTDYFSFLPWFFLFVTGYYLHKLMNKYQIPIYQFHNKENCLSKFGKHSLLIYLLHQPIVYMIAYLIIVL